MPQECPSSPSSSAPVVVGAAQRASSQNSTDNSAPYNSRNLSELQVASPPIGQMPGMKSPVHGNASPHPLDPENSSPLNPPGVPAELTACGHTPQAGGPASSPGMERNRRRKPGKESEGRGNAPVPERTGAAFPQPMPNPPQPSRWWHDPDQFVRVVGLLLFVLMALGLIWCHRQEPDVLKWALAFPALLVPYWLGHRAGSKTIDPKKNPPHPG